MKPFFSSALTLDEAHVSPPFRYPVPCMEHMQQAQTSQEPCTAGLGNRHSRNGCVTV